MSKKEKEKAKENRVKERDQYIDIDGQKMRLSTVINQYKHLLEKQAAINNSTDTTSQEFKECAIQKSVNNEQLKPYQAELIRMQDYLEATKRRMIIIFEGRDAAGKGGTIRSITRYMNEKHYRVVALGKPTTEQKTQWYYQKYAAHFPSGGEIVLFDRSWYNRAMVERVFGFCTEDEYQKFMEGVTWFERDMVRQGTILIKLYFSVDKEEQARRFERRKTDPLRQWKFSEIDMQAQERWDDFTEVKYEMLKHTHTEDAPWIIIRSHDKHQARLNAMRVILNATNFEKLDPDIDLKPDMDIVFDGGRELALMEAEHVETGQWSF